MPREGLPDPDSKYDYHWDALTEFEQRWGKIKHHLQSLSEAAAERESSFLVQQKHVTEAAESLLETKLRSNPRRCLFISYSHQDRDSLQDLLHSLDASGVTYFLAQRDIELGETWYKRIIQEIRDCRMFLSFITPSFLQSEWRLLEAGVALASEKEFLQVFYHSDPDQLEDSLKSFQTKTVKNNSDLASVVSFLESKCNISADA